MIEYAVPKESSKAHSIIFSKPIDAIKPLLDSANTQKANRKMAGVRIKVMRIFGMYFFIVMVMGILWSRMNWPLLQCLAFEFL